MAKENYLAYTFESKDEIFLALLSQYPFASFEEQDAMTIGYIAEKDVDTDVNDAIILLCQNYKVKHSTEVIKPQNWNAQWEASFQPVEINNFCRVRADFHDQVNGFEYDLVINPKMAFGTGHHETTWMMIDAMSKLAFDDKIVFDYGAGTGVLAILAEKLGASKIDALDIEQESFENTIENSEINNCNHIISIHGELDKVRGKMYDVILANINRHVLLTTAIELHNILKVDGTLLMSGILDQDLDLITECYTGAGFSIKEVKQRGKWRCLAMTPS